MDPAAAWETFLIPWKGGDPDALDEVLAPNAVYHVPPFPDMDVAGLKGFAAGFAQAFPDFSITLDDTIVADGRIVYLWHCEATLTGESPTIPGPPTGKHTEASGTVITYVTDNKVTEAWHHGDWLGWLQKAGAIEGLG